MKRAGFTLIELLVAMAILVIIVLAVAQLFQESTVAWESGRRRTQTAMIGRAILGYVAQDVSLAVWGEGEAPSGLTFSRLGGTNALESITYSAGGGISRSSDGNDVLYENADGRLEITSFDMGFDPSPSPRFADVSVDVKTTDKGRDETRTFTTRVYLANRNRYYYD